MSPVADRMWSIRDALLLWLYEEKAQGNNAPQNIDRNSIQTTAKWRADPITEPEVNAALDYLKDQGLVAGAGVWGGGVLRPRITSRGENQVASGLSVCPDPPQQANTTGATNNYHITTHGPANVAVNSQDFSQTHGLESATDKIQAVVEALEGYVASNEPNSSSAQVVAAELREASKDPHAKKGALRALLATAISAVAVSAGTEAGKQITSLAVEAIQTLG
ncbi:hypothetical protein [Hoyosella subflava]|uniref:Putative serine recombinase n=1 Tax=Hoyosella subflava (strain DSM 45089 / JCM 17490 / NBRC 109087 / DQS3-9A1) TaxID=443218 RepID=F6ESM7_HOYSD|nr:hypothetical protein [Hoyosella subflava]AEF43148.1 Putative serine recombinase [Hoyosella subflava DQS3-9A1]